MVGKNSKGCWGKAERMGRSGLSLQISAAPAPGKIPLSLEAGSVSGAQSQVGIGLLGMLLEDEDLEGSRDGLGRAEGPFGARSKVLPGEKTPRRLQSKGELRLSQEQLAAQVSGSRWAPAHLGLFWM